MGITRGKVLDANLINLFVIALGIKTVKRRLFPSDPVTTEIRPLRGKIISFLVVGHVWSQNIAYCFFLSRVCDVQVSYANNLDIWHTSHRDTMYRPRELSCKRLSSTRQWFSTACQNVYRFVSLVNNAEQRTSGDKLLLGLLNRIIMGERTPRRNNNIVLSAQQLDHNASKARNLNKRAGNRLRLRKGSIDGHQSTNLHSLNYEMRRLKHELREITQTSGTLENSETITERTMPGKAGADSTRRKKSKRVASLKNSDKDYGLGLAGNALASSNSETQTISNIDSSRRKSLSLPSLPSMSSTLPQLTSRSEISRVEENATEDSFTTITSSKPKQKERRQSRRKLSLEVSPAGQNAKHSTDRSTVNVSVTNTNGETERFLPVTQAASKLETSLVNLDAVKDRIQNRLSQPANTNQLMDDEDDDPDITPYLHVPPDGLPRTVYLLPPLTDLLQEAKKARYLRRPKKPLQEVDMDDPDRELGIDEIFSKKG